MKAVIFDLDGTLVDSMWVWEEIDKEFLRNLNIDPSVFNNEELGGMSFTETALYFKNKFNLTHSVDEIKITWNKMGATIYTEKVEIKPFVREFLKFLKQHNIKMGIASSNSRELVELILDRFEIIDYFDCIKVSCEVERGKPFPFIYMETAKELGVLPEECLVFEDIPDGVMAGKNAGMTVWAIRDRQSEKLVKELKTIADKWILDYDEARQIIIKEILC
ncbi:HAD family hydrolase [Candidatus Epulonipiscium fishelsonii]|uniref:HAD family hydrolase n=1 Tax=Candidatus Epulonipiscium fishelsonii TaxID=77094 RepID=A0ACC8XHP5_9FIRM|nr:HAD family hydrolase [Epulopiscium sp. SCG-B11WGA-EpuloA1]